MDSMTTAAMTCFSSCWFDKRFIHFLSTLHCAESATPTLVDRRNPDGSKTAVSCPPLLPDYQQYMRGVDREIN